MLSAPGMRPVVMRPTLPVGFGPVAAFHPPPLSPGMPVVAVCFSSPPHPGQVLDVSDVLFKYAAWQNGIKIGVPEGIFSNG